MPVFDGELYIEHAIRSVLGQTIGDFELIISDNASSDRTPEICRDLAGADTRIIYSRNSENIGAAGNYNRLFRLATAPYFRWMNADDLCAPDLHEKCLASLERNPHAVLCYGKTTLIDKDGEILEPYEDNLDLRHRSAKERFLGFMGRVGLSNVLYGLMKRSALSRTALMGNGSYPAADINLIGELTLYGQFIELPERLFFRRVHRMASSRDRSDDAVQTDFWTGGRATFTFPHWKQSLACLRAIRRAPLPIMEKLRLQGHILRRMVWIRNVLFEDVSLEMRRLLDRKT
jgi:glycosyltransferase involved in cell wall biosynthesis